MTRYPRHLPNTPIHRVPLAILVALACLASAATAALAGPPTAIPGSPITVYIGEQGQIQGFRDGDPAGFFYRSTNQAGDAGFFLAFPDASPSSLSGKVYGFTGSAGPGGLEQYTPLTQGAVTGSGSAGDPFRQVTSYSVRPTTTNLLTVTQITTLVNGAQRFTEHWDVKNDSGAAIKFKAITAADFYWGGSDRGTGIFTQGPPRFIGGTNVDSGLSGGFVEAGGPSPPWSAYQALAFGSAPNEVWGKVQAAASIAGASFDNTVLGEPADNAAGVEWDQAMTTPLANGATQSYELVMRNAVPSALQLNPTNGGAPQGVPVNITATAVDSDGTPYSGRTLRYAITGVNPSVGSTTIDPAGHAVITDPGTNAGDDTVVAYVDFNNNSIREPVEPQASALATFVDNVPPSCTVKVSGDRPGGGGAGKPLVITVSCGEAATVTVNGTLQPIGAAKAAVVDKKNKKTVTLKLAPTTSVVQPGQAAPINLKISKAIAKKYAGKKLRATITVTATDQKGNATKVKATKTIKLAAIKKKKH
jgi:hypothetical protein